MSIGKYGIVQRQLQTLFNLGIIQDLTDGQILERFSAGPGKDAELAFAALVERNGAMVLRVCRNVLTDPNDADDAFQATFLVLAKRARGLWVRDSLGPWLHRVAYHVSSCARSAAARRRRHEQRAAGMMARIHSSGEAGIGDELTRAIHEEINQLPDRYREPIVLCDLEGHTYEEAARRMRSPVGTVKSWRSRGRAKLRERLARRGITPTDGLFWPSFPAGTATGVPPALGETTVRCVIGGALMGSVSASINSLVREALRTMVMKKIKLFAYGCLSVCALAVGANAVLGREPTNGPGTAPVADAAAIQSSDDTAERLGQNGTQLDARYLD